MSNQLALICKTLDTMQGSLAGDLNGTGINPERFIATAKTAIQTHVQKDRLEQADRQSLYLAIKKSASDGLMPDNREAALVVYSTKTKDEFGKETWVNQVQYQPMVQGLVKLARQSGEILSINSEVVYSNDKFKLDFNMDGIDFCHSPDWSGDRGDPILVWATVKLKSGEVIARAYPKKRIEQIATRSKQSDNYNPSKGKDWEEFWRKAAIRNILKYAPKSTQLDRALEASDGEFEQSQSFTQQVAEEAKQDPKERQTKAKSVIMESQEPDVIDAEIVEQVPQEFDDAPI